MQINHAGTQGLIDCDECEYGMIGDDLCIVCNGAGKLVARVGPKQKMTPSRFNAKNKCAEFERITFQLGIRPIKKAQPLMYGTLIHDGLEAWWKAWQTGKGTEALDRAVKAITVGRPDGIDDYTMTAIIALMVGYDVRWGKTMGVIDVLEVERQYSGPLVNPDMGKASIDWTSDGKIDAIIRYKDTKYLIEHKSSSADLSPGSAYWARLRIDPQLSAYFDGAKVVGHEVAGCYYDVLKKPSIRPFKKTDDVKMTKGRVCGTKANPCPGRRCEKCAGSGWKEKPRPHEKTRLADETVDEYRARVTDVIASAPGQYYQRQLVVRLESELIDARRDFFHQAMRIGAFVGMSAPKNPDMCHRMYGGTCPYWGPCSGVGSLDDANKYIKIGPHPELTQS